MSAINQEGRKSDPTCCGVSFISQRHISFKLRTRVTPKATQAIVVSVMSLPIAGCYVSGTKLVVGCYVSPRASVEQFEEFLGKVNNWLRERETSIGDLNSCDKSSDVTNNRRGPTFRKWAEIQDFSTQLPSTPTLPNCSGSSKVDLCFHRNCLALTITVKPLTDISYNARVIAERRLSCTDKDLRISRSVMEIESVKLIIAEAYVNSTPRHLITIKSAQ